MGYGTFGVHVSQLLDYRTDRLVVVDVLAGRARWRLVELRPTGRTERRAVHVALATYEADVPLRAPHVLGEAPTLAELDAQVRGPAKPVPGPAPVTAGTEAARRRDDAYRRRDARLAELWSGFAWQVRSAAETAEPRPSLVVCDRCNATGFVEAKCPCAVEGLHGYHYLGSLGEDGVLRAAGSPGSEPVAPGPACGRCGGSGRERRACQYCWGVGSVAGRPRLVLSQPATGEERSLVFDAAELVRHGARLVPSVVSYRSWGQLWLTLDMTGYLQAVLGEVGASYETHLPQRGRWVNGWDREVTDVPWTVPFGVRAKHMYRLEPHGGPKGPLVDVDQFVEQLPSPEAVLEVISGSLAEMIRYAPPVDDRDVSARRLRLSTYYGVDVDDNGMATGRTIVLRHLDDPLTIVTDMAAIAARDGGAVAMARGFIATEEWGPAVMLTDGDGAPLDELAVDYGWPEVLMMARDVLAGSGPALP